jgi:hypothetical protein
MKILFVINNFQSTMLEYEHTGMSLATVRRAVEIELTDEQIQKIGIRQLGMDCGKPYFETIETVSLTAPPSVTGDEK